MSTGIASVSMGNTTGARRRHAAAPFIVFWEVVLCERKCIDFSRRGEEDVVEPRACQLDVALHHLRRWCRQRRSPPQTILKPVPPGPAQALKRSSARRRVCILGLNSAVADPGNALGALRAIWARSRTKVTAFVYFTYTKQVYGIQIVLRDILPLHLDRSCPSFRI